MAPPPERNTRVKTQKAQGTKCGKCQDLVITDDEEENIGCSYCKNWYHSMCCGLNRKAFKKAIANKEIPFACDICAKEKGNSTKSLTSNSSTNREYAEIIERLKTLEILPEMEKSLKYVTDQYDDLCVGQSEMKKSISRLEKENNELRERIDYLEFKTRQFDGERCKRKCIISKLNVAEKDFNAEEVVKQIGNAAGVNIEENDLETVFVRRSRHQGQSGKNADSIIVNFSNLRVKQKLMSSKKSLASTQYKDVKLFDELSDANLQLYNHAINLRKNGYKYLYHKSGKIFVRLTDTSQPIVIRSLQHVDTLLLQRSPRRPENRRSQQHEDTDGEKED